MTKKQDTLSTEDALDLVQKIKAYANELGFQQLGVTDTDLSAHIEHYQAWLNAGHHGELDYMAKHGSKRWVADELVEGTLRVISVRMDYFTDPQSPQTQLNNRNNGYISRYTLGRDYHKLIRSRLKKLIQFIREQADMYQFRAFVDSAPILERAFAQKAGLGWFGKNTMIINRGAGSWFFLGEIFTDLPLPLDKPYEKEHCGSCSACLDVCPTQAFVGPHILDSRRCISYLTIELKGSIPVELRSKMGNRIFGCDDCQIVCPWNKFSKPSSEPDFTPRHQLDSRSLVELFSWDEETFLQKTEGSAIRRAGYESWLRNIAVALGNAPTSPEIYTALHSKTEYPSEIVQEHITWALNQHNEA
jgi:epoxyqueuosine reductase